MKKIVPFKKEITFQTNVSEITSISLEHSLHIEDKNLITGNFNISGEYKIADTSINTEIFNFELPFDINVDDKYDLSNVVVDIDDFYYEIINNKSLEVNIEVLIDKLSEKKLIENVKDNTATLVSEEVSDIMENENIIGEDETRVEDKKGEDDIIMERCIEQEDILSEFDLIDNNEDTVLQENKKLDKIEMERPIELSTQKEVKSIEKISSLFDNLDVSSETYKTYKVYIIRTGDNIENVLQKYNISKEELEKYNNLSELKIGDKLIIPSINDAKV